MAGYPDVVNKSIDLSEEARDAKITVLRQTCRKKMGQFLDLDVDDINDDIGHMTNYRGLAELIGYQYQEIEEISEDRRGSTYALLEKWGNDPARNPTIGSLWDHLKTLQRYDVIEECAKYINLDVEAAKKNQVAPLLRDPDHHVDGNLVLTREDIQYGKPQYYDAFVCGNLETEQDMEFLKRLVQELEEKRSIRLYIPDRDNLPGDSKYEAYDSHIKCRWKMMLVVVSNSYLSSPCNDLCVKFAQALSPATRQKKLVPILIEKVVMPNVLRDLTLYDFTNSNMEDWDLNWERLYRSLSESNRDWNEQAQCESTRPCNNINFVQEPTKNETDSKVKTFFKNLFGNNSKT